jgi:hypothetical protein
MNPLIKCNMFYYNCGSKFVVDILFKYFNQYNGSIIFANGNECLIYQFNPDNGSFQKKKQITGNLQKRQRKGGQSALRIARLAEESRHTYIVKIIDELNSLRTEKNDENNWIFGSTEILNMILTNKTRLLKVNNGSFLEFDNRTINDTQKWLKYLDLNDKNKYDIQYEQIIQFLANDIDRLDFDPNNRELMEYYVSNTLTSEKQIPFPKPDSDFYNHLYLFAYIGIKYYAEIQYNDDDDEM